VVAACGRRRGHELGSIDGEVDISPFHVRRSTVQEFAHRDRYAELLADLADESVLW
jgi:hypothetical protein